jgi:hypothetical protein
MFSLKIRIWLGNSIFKNTVHKVGPYIVEGSVSKHIGKLKS